MNHDSIWRDPAFVVFWAARAISIVGNTITTVVMPILVFQLTGSAFQTSLLTTIVVLPYFGFGLIAGALADRVNRKRLMVSCDLINCLLLASIPIATMLDQLSLAQIYAVALLSATAFVWFDAADFGALPSLVGRERITAANSVIMMTWNVIGIAGPSLAGVLVASFGPGLTLGAEALSYALSAVLLALIPRAFNSARTASSPVIHGSPITSIIGDIREGLRFIWQHRLLRPLTLVGFGNSFAVGGVQGLIVVYAIQALSIPQNDARLGTLFTAGAIGAALASLLLPILNRRYAPGWITLVGLGLNALLVLGLVMAPGFASGVVLFLLWEGCHALIITNGISLRQLLTPDHLQSRVNTSARMIAWGGQPFGAAIGGLIADTAGIRSAYLVIAAGVAATALLGWFTALRTTALSGTELAEKAESA